MRMGLLASGAAHELGTPLATVAVMDGLLLMAGLTMPDLGRLTLRDAPITGPGPERGLVFQSYSLLPWMTVEQNVALAVDSVHKDHALEYIRIKHECMTGPYANMKVPILGSISIGPNFKDQIECGD